MYAMIATNGGDAFRMPVAIRDRQHAEAVAAEKYNGAAEVLHCVEFCHGKCGRVIEVENKPPSPWYCPDCALWRETTLKERAKTLLAALTRATAAMVVGA